MRTCFQPPPTTMTQQHHGHLAHYAIASNHNAHAAKLIPNKPTAGKQGSLTNIFRCPDATTWTRSTANKWGRLLPHGVGHTRPVKEEKKRTGTLFFIKKTQVPAGRKVTYANFVCNIRPQKEETHRVRMTAGGDKLDYPGDASSPTVSMLGAKLHINSTISDARQGARYLGLDIKNYYLGTPLAYYQYMRVRPTDIPQEIWDDPNYDIHMATDSYVYLEIRHGTYGLKEAGIIAYNQLVKKL